MLSLQVGFSLAEMALFMFLSSLVKRRIFFEIMSKDKEILDSITDKEYEHGFVTNVEQEFIPKGLNEDIIRLISAKKQEPE